MVELTALAATRATRSLCSATNLVNAGHSTEMRPTQSVLRRSGGGCILLQRYGKRDFPVNPSEKKLLISMPSHFPP